ncbi:PAS domain S-box-containing protein [Fodinibius salinus]|uniref:histidine kinase n=1 Tax=Fodinibius salinus TaxID=860790 RepID=A0A5D3YKX3_9BACT|nr:PAS domain S-box protein [Fodinibius salinus]TYP94090.1 PAS domain S-box-containing protein [Fodinibius salinus]
MSENNRYSFSDGTGKILNRGTVILFACASTDEFPLVSVSESAKNILGFSTSYLLERENGWSDRIHPDDKTAVFEGFEEVMSQGISIINEYRFKRKDGVYIWLRDELTLAEDSNGNEVVYGSSIDITERKKAELALKESQRKYQSIVNHINDIAYSLDSDGNITLLNSSWTERTGYSIDDCMGTAFWNYVHPEDRESIKSFFQSLIKNQGTAEKVFRIATADGEFYWAEVYAKCLTNGKETQVNGTIIDISDNLAYLDKKEKINQELDERVAQHTQELRSEIEERRRAETNIQQRLSYEQAISECSSLLLESSSPKALKETLEIMREVTNADRVYLYKNFKAGGELRIRLAVEACADGVIPNTKTDTSTQLAYSEIPWWHKQLSSGNIINTDIEDLPETEREILGAQGVKSVLAIPIRIEEEWYGYVGFADIKNKRSWKNNEIQFLKTAANIISAHEKRKKIEKSLVQQQNYTEAILDSLPSIYLLMDEDFEFEQWNHNAEEYTGYSTEEFSQLNVFDLVIPEDHEELKEGTERVKNHNNDKGRELRLQTKSGNAIPYYWRGHYIELDQQEYFLCVGIDITQQKETEKALLDEKRFNDALIESMPGIFYMINSDSKFHRWNQNLEDLLGYSSEELKSIGPVDVFDKEEFEQVDKKIKEVYEIGQSELEAEIVAKDGSKTPYYFTGRLFSRGGDEYLVGVGQDISEQKKAREQLKKSEELFRNLFLKAPAAIVMVDPDNNIQDVNESFEQLFGYEEEEIVGKDVDEELVPEQRMEEAPQFLDEEFIEKKFHIESQRLTKDGELIDVYVAPIPVYVDGTPIAAFGMYIDISEQKTYEKELQKSLEEKKMLLKEVHHRIKNNLAVVTGLIQLQLYETENPEVRATLEESESRIQTIGLIHEKIYNSQTLSGVSCEAYIGDLVETISKTNKMDKEVTISKSIDDIHLNTGQAVPFALLVNEIVTNSYKYAFEDQTEGKIKIDISREGDELHAEIRDNGKGLPDDFAEENVDSLGMTLVQNFINQLGAKGHFKNDNGTCLELSFEIEEPTTGPES